MVSYRSELTDISVGRGHLVTHVSDRSQAFTRSIAHLVAPLSDGSQVVTLVKTLEYSSQPLRNTLSYNSSLVIFHVHFLKAWM